MSELAPPAWEESVDGCFPFGQPNRPRPVRVPTGTVRQVVLGVYPSAVHVGWRRPDAVGLTVRQRQVRSMAVDVEPVVFWDGADASERVEQWKRDVGFLDGDAPDGHGWLSPATNGPSGVTVAAQYLDSLPYSAAETALLDVFPVYLVKVRGPGATTREQGDAVLEVYDAAVPGLPPGRHGTLRQSTLPKRPSARELPRVAVGRFGDWLLRVLHELAPDHIVTLGQEPWTVIQLLDGVDVVAPARNLGSMRRSGYGKPGTLTVAGRHIPWTPLAHPGLLRQSDRDRPGSWSRAHEQWRARQGGGPHR